VKSQIKRPHITRAACTQNLPQTFDGINTRLSLQAEKELTFGFVLTSISPTFYAQLFCQFHLFKNMLTVCSARFLHSVPRIVAINTIFLTMKAMILDTHGTLKSAKDRREEQE